MRKTFAILQAVLLSVCFPGTVFAQDSGSAAAIDNLLEELDTGWSPADWPQRQRDPQRSGHSSMDVKPPFQTVWHYYYPDDEQKVNPWVQPVIYKGRVFAATMSGLVYAHDARTGAVLWKKQAAKGPFLHTGGCMEDKVFFGNLDGHVYAINTADGAIAWKFYADRHGFQTGILVAADKIFIGSRSGTFYALDPESGDVVWRFKAGAPIFNTAAYNAPSTGSGQGGRVYFADEGIHVYALDAATGEQLWKTGRLWGVTARAYHPIVAAGKVFLRTFNPAVDWRFPLERVEKGGTARYPLISRGVSQEAFKYYTQKPHTKNLYAFDELTGEESLVMHNCGGSNTGYSAPPALDRDGNLFLCVCALTDETSNLFIRVDPATGMGKDVVWLPGWGNMGTVDEQQEQSTAGDYMFTVQSEWQEVGIMAAFDAVAPAIHSAKRESAGGWKLSSSKGVMFGRLDFNMDESSHPFAFAGDMFYKIGAHALVAFRAGGQ